MKGGQVRQVRQVEGGRGLGWGRGVLKTHTEDKRLGPSAWALGLDSGGWLSLTQAAAGLLEGLCWSQ